MRSKGKERKGSISNGFSTIPKLEAEKNFEEGYCFALVPKAVVDVNSGWGRPF